MSFRVPFLFWVIASSNPVYAQEEDGFDTANPGSSEIRIEAYIGSEDEGREEVEAEVYVDGSTTGLQTPVVLRNLSSGTHEIRLRSECSEASAIVDLTPGNRENLSLDLALQPSFLEVRVVPSEARIQLDGTRLDSDSGSRVPVNCGEHALSASLDGYRSILETLTVAPGETQSTVIYLEALGMGTLVLDVEPSNARVSLDGERLGSRVESIELHEGPHVVSVQRLGYIEANQSFLIATDRMTNLEIVLERSAAERVSGPRSSIPRIRLAAYGLTATGAVLSVLGGVQFLQTSSVYDEYRARVETVNEGRREPAYATDFYGAEVAPRASRMRTSLGLGSTALAGGLVLALRY